MQLQPRLSLSVSETAFFLVYFCYFLTSSYCSKLQCYIGRFGTKEQKSPRLVNCTTPPQVRPITSCLIYRYQSNGNGSQADDATQLRFSDVGTEDFLCDERHVCSGDGRLQNQWIMNVTYKGMKSDIYCCKTPGCNDPRGFTKPQTHVQCYSGRAGKNTMEGDFSACSSNYCYNVTTGNASRYGCDRDGRCEKNGLSDSCTDIKGSNVTERLCCCEKSHCNVKIQKNSVTPAKRRQAPSKAKVTVPKVPEVLPESHRQQKLERSRVAGIVSAVVLGIALVILLTVIAFKQWQKYREKYNFSYMQLTADMMTL